MTWEFTPHMRVYLSGGRRLGRVEEVGHAADILHIQEGALLIRDWYIPMSAVADVTAQGVNLSADRGTVTESNWGVPSDEYLRSQGSTPGYEHTSAVEVTAAGRAVGIGPDD